VQPYRGLWLWLGGLFLTLFGLLTAIAIAYFLKEAQYSLFGNAWMPIALVCVLVAFACFLGAVQNWPWPPWARSAFPDVRIEINGTGSIDTEREGGTGLDVPAHLRSFNARFTSSEKSRPISLTAVLYVRLIPGSWGRAGEALCPPPGWVLPPSLGLNPLSMPVALAPGATVTGQLVYEVPRYYLDKVAEPLAARLEIADQVSGKRMSIPAELGQFDRSRMTPASGRPEILGPEYELSESQPHDAGQVPP
jgi:hypothetical protein